MRSMQWQLGILGTISVFAYRQRVTKKNLCRDGRSQDLPNTDFQPAVQCTHSTTNTHKITTTTHMANQQQLHTRQLKTSNHTHETHQNFTTSTKAREYCVQFIVIFFFFFTIINSLTLSPQSFCLSNFHGCQLNVNVALQLHCDAFFG